jgi:hypothetical protein
MLHGCRQALGVPLARGLVLSHTGEQCMAGISIACVRMVCMHSKLKLQSFCTGPGSDAREQRPEVLKPG